LLQARQLRVLLVLVQAKPSCRQQARWVQLETLLPLQQLQLRR
jgi:hypothetical protein